MQANDEQKRGVTRILDPLELRSAAFVALVTAIHVIGWCVIRHYPEPVLRVLAARFVDPAAGSEATRASLAYFDAQIAFVWNMVFKCGLLLAIVPVFRRYLARHDATRPALGIWPHGRSWWLVVPLIAILSYAGAWITTPRIDFGVGPSGVGYGHDGLAYGVMAERFEPFLQTVPPPFCYRYLPSTIVFLSGLNVFTGFGVLNFLAHALSLLALYGLLVRYDFDTRFALLGTALLAALKFGLKFWIYYPILTDGVGMMLLLVLLYSTANDRHGLYFIALSAAMATRENLLAVGVFYILSQWRRHRSISRLAVITCAHALPLSLLILIRRYPLFPPLFAFDTIGHALDNLTAFFVQPERTFRFFLAHLNSLGLLVLIPVLGWRRSRRFLAQRYEWSAYLLVTFIITLIGGSDTDRFALWQAPPLIMLSLNALAESRRSFDTRSIVILALIQNIWAETVFLWKPDIAFYLSLYAAHAPLFPLLVHIAGAVVFVVLATALREG